MKKKTITKVKITENKITQVTPTHRHPKVDRDNYEQLVMLSHGKNTSIHTHTHTHE